ncbi:MAG TPA: sensor domain-containing diguanylate cyclase [Acidimicrobiales bacterium]|nr:sensor domain-containing diguanylate cyclase [Acidimicrobiales bacterium]
MDPSRSLELWLREHPSAIAGALSIEGTTMDMPAEVPLLPSQQVDGRSLLDLVDAADSPRLVNAFVEARTNGIAVTQVRMAAPPHRTLTVHYLDTREQYGVILRLATVDDGDGSGLEPVDLAAMSPGRPRLATVRKSTVSALVDVDEATTLMLGWARDEMVGHPTLEFIHPDDHAKAIDNWMEFIRVRGSHAVRLRYLRKDGSWLWLETSNQWSEGPGAEPTVLCQMIDISEEMAAHEALRRGEQLLRRVTETVPVGLAELAVDRSVTYCNGRLRNLLASADVGSVAELLASLRLENPRDLEMAIDDALDRGRDLDVDVRLVGSGREVDRQCQVALRAVTDGWRVLGALLCVMDVTELKVQAATDALTGVHNRPAILDAVRRALQSAPDVAVLFIDLDRFKPVNDRFGHDVGDRLLAEIAHALGGAVRKGDVVGRIGGDEFLVVCPDVGSPAAGLELAGRLALSIGACGWDLGVRLSASTGVAWVAAGSVSAEEAIGRADAAMYAAKRSRGGPPVLWDEALACVRT